jgi:hypothetical protein
MITVQENQESDTWNPSLLDKIWGQVKNAAVMALTATALVGCGQPQSAGWLQSRIWSPRPAPLTINSEIALFQSIKQEAGKPPQKLDGNAFINVYDLLREWINNDGEDREGTAVFEIPDTTGTIKYRVTTVERKRAKTLEISWTNDNRLNHVPVNWHYIFYCEGNQIWFKDSLVTPGEPSMITEERFRELIDLGY